MPSDHKVLVTAARFMPTTALIHALHRASAEVHVVDHDTIASGLHSRFAVPHLVSPPAANPQRYADEIAAICRDQEVDQVVGSFEDGFFLSRYRDRLPIPLFVPDFDVIEKLHNKASFVSICGDLGLATPATEIVTSQDALRDAIAAAGEYFARPAYSRGGAHNLTNHGDHADDHAVENCHPTDSNPWLVQEFIEGDDMCLLVVARNGEIELTCAYEPAIPSAGGFAVRFTSIDYPAANDIAGAVCRKFNYTGLMGLDIRRTPAGPVVIECNPRTTAGVFLADEAVLGRAITEGLDAPHTVPPGRSKQYDCYLLNRNLMQRPMHEIAGALFTEADALISQRDIMPFLHSFRYGRIVTKRARQTHRSVTEASLGDVTWNGDPLPAA